MGIDPTTIKVGHEIPHWVREGGFEQWNRFAAVSYQFSAHHMDDEVARQEGFPRAFIMAPFAHAYLHAMLREWVGENGWIETVDMRLKNPIFRGRTLTAGATVTGVRREGDDVVMDLD